MAEYEHHIFVSYRRSDEDWVRWTRENLARALRSLLGPRLGKVGIYVDETIETGASWPQHLALSLARSRLMVAVLSRDYFQSDWCRLELALMLHREQSSNFRTVTNPFGLIIPLVIDDGDCFPKEVQEMQAEALHTFANPFIRIDSPKQETLADILKDRVCPTIEHALARVPAFDNTWEQIAHKQFEHMFQIRIQSQTVVPSLVLPQLP
jgi:hypothetical protein